jgi:ADP-ribose pyrophosphatase YjhB (NUDIX family)
MSKKVPLISVDIIIEYNDNIVLIERANPPFGWALPGGFVEYGENIEKTAKREAKEETGLNIRLKELLYCYSDPLRDPRGHTISVVFIAEPKNLKESPQGGDDALKAKIFSLKDLPENIAFDHKKILKDYIEPKTKGKKVNPEQEGRYE